MARTLGLPALLGPAGRQRELALALIISRIVQPGSKLSTLTWWDDTTLGGDLGMAGAAADDIYAAMDWLGHRQDAIEAELARRHLGPELIPSKMALFDLVVPYVDAPGKHEVAEPMQRIVFQTPACAPRHGSRVLCRDWLRAGETGAPPW